MHTVPQFLKRLATASVGALLLAAGAPSSAHHSYAMYDGSIYKVFTGVIVRIVPNAARCSAAVGNDSISVDDTGSHNETTKATTAGIFIKAILVACVEFNEFWVSSRC